MSPSNNSIMHKNGETYKYIAKVGKWVPMHNLTEEEMRELKMKKLTTPVKCKYCKTTLKSGEKEVCTRCKKIQEEVEKKIDKKSKEFLNELDKQFEQWEYDLKSKTPNPQIKEKESIKPHDWQSKLVTKVNTLNYGDFSVQSDLKPHIPFQQSKSLTADELQSTMEETMKDENMLIADPPYNFNYESYETPAEIKHRNAYLKKVNSKERLQTLLPTMHREEKIDNYVARVNEITEDPPEEKVKKLKPRSSIFENPIGEPRVKTKVVRM